MATVLVRYVGAGSETFPDLHWSPEPGEQREVPEELAPEDHPRLKRIKHAGKTGAKKED